MPVADLRQQGAQSQPSGDYPIQSILATTLRNSNMKTPAADYSNKGAQSHSHMLELQPTYKMTGAKCIPRTAAIIDRWRTEPSKGPSGTPSLQGAIRSTDALQNGMVAMLALQHRPEDTSGGLNPTRGPVACQPATAVLKIPTDKMIGPRPIISGSRRYPKHSRASKGRPRYMLCAASKSGIAD